MLKSISASMIFNEHAEVKQHLWGGDFWKEGYFAGTVGDKAQSEVIRKHVESHRGQEIKPQQLYSLKTTMSAL